MNKQNAITQSNGVPNAVSLETVLLDGDLSVLSPEQRVMYYKQVCESLGLNPLTKPFDYIRLNGRLTLYARKDAGDQLRKINNISIEIKQIEYIDDFIVVTVTAKTPDGRTDSEIGAVSRKEMMGNFGNALMKAVTKAKRRVTLSICGLGWLDETEVDSIPDAKVISVDGAELPKTDGNSQKSKTVRPLTPEQVKSSVEKIASIGADVTDDVINAVIACIDFEVGDDMKANGLIRYLTGHSVEEMTAGEYNALYRWLKPARDENGVWATDEMSKRELELIMDALYPEKS